MASLWSSINARVAARSAIRRLRGYAGFWLKALSQPTIDLTLRTHPCLSTRIVESPGLSLPPAELDALSSQLRVIARKTLPCDSLTYGVLSGKRGAMTRAIVTLICEETTGRPIAFNALSVLDVELDGQPIQVTHLGLVMVDPDAQGQGLSWVLYGLTALALFARDGLRPKWISNVTQVPAVVGMVSESFSDVFPSPHPAARRSFAPAIGARNHEPPSGCVRCGGRSGVRRSALCHRQCLYRRIGCTQESVRNRRNTAPRPTMHSAPTNSTMSAATTFCNLAASISRPLAAIC
jgi:hypothetical protein